MQRVTTAQKRELLRFVIFFAIPLPLVWFRTEIRPVSPTPAELVTLVLMAGALWSVSWLVAGWVVRRSPWREVTPDAPGPSEPPSATPPDPRSE
jgi:hypothetical protein